MFLRMGFSIKTLIFDIIGLFEFCIIIRVALSWVAPGSRAHAALVSFTEPAIYPVRVTLSKLIGMFTFDFSPAVTIALLGLLRRLVDYLFR